MNEKVAVRDFYGRILGWIETTATGKTVRDFYGRILGKYDKASNTTRDFYGHIIAQGDQVALLLSMNKK